MEWNDNKYIDENDNENIEFDNNKVVIKNNYKLNLFKKTIVISLLLVLLYSCEKDEKLELKDTPEIDNTELLVDDLMNMELWELLKIKVVERNSDNHNTFNDKKKVKDNSSHSLEFKNDTIFNSITSKQKIPKEKRERLISKIVDRLRILFNS